MEDKPLITPYASYARDWADYEIDESCHFYKVEVFDRLEDSSKGTHTVVEEGKVTQDGDMRRNVSRRRTSIALHFWSEVRQPPWDRFVMCIFQHKGGEYVKIVSLTEYLLNNQ